MWTLISLLVLLVAIWYLTGKMFDEAESKDWLGAFFYLAVMVVLVIAWA